MKCAQVISLTALLVLCTCQWSSADSNDITTEFLVELYKKIIIKNAGKNLCFSPISISTVFGMLLPGAGGSTKMQMIKALKLTSFKDADEILEAYQGIIEEVESRDDKNTVHLADKLFISKKFTSVLNPKFTSDLLNHFHSNLTVLDFSKTEESRAKINDWVSKKTNEKIKDFLPKESVKSSTVLELVGTVHVQANWQYPFDLKKTKPDTFTTSKGEKITVDMMHLSPKLLNYVDYKELNCEIVEMPFVGNRLVLYILLPREGKFEAVQKSLTKPSLIKARDSLKKRWVEVILPKFVIEQRIPLTNHLKSMGMIDLFDEKKSDLYGITTKRDLVLYASEVAHKTIININEYGVLTETATGGPVVKDSPVKPITLFNTNRPFMYMLEDKMANTTLLCGHMVKKPTTGDDPQ